MKHIALIAWIAMVAAGCAQIPEDHQPGRVLRAEGIAIQATPVQPSLGREDLVALVKEGKDAGAIIARLTETRSVIRLTATEILDLRAQGVPASVLDHLLQAERKAQADLLNQESLRRDTQCGEELRRLDQQWWLRCQMNYPPFPHFPFRRWP